MALCLPLGACVSISCLHALLEQSLGAIPFACTKFLLWLFYSFSFLNLFYYLYLPGHPGSFLQFPSAWAASLGVHNHGSGLIGHS